MSLPLSIEFSDIEIPSLRFFTLPSTYKAAAEFNKTMSLYGPFSPSRRLMIFFAFCSGSPPIRSSNLDNFKINFSGLLS